MTTTTTMAENSNFIAEGQKKSYFNIEIVNFAGEFKTRAIAETTSLSSTPLLEPNL